MSATSSVKPLLWLVAAVCLLACLVFCYRAYRHITTHPERLRGLGAVAVLSVVAVVGGLLLGLGVNAAVGDAPAADAPLGVGDLASVQDARWGYVRVARIVDNGWKQPAKDEGTCWVIDDDVDGTDGRVETHTDKTYCTRRHTLEVIDVWAWNRDADAPYPGPEAFLKAVGKRCGGVVDDLLADADVAALNPTLGAEYPTEDGWFDGDHDVACVVVTEPTQGGLVS